MAEEGSPVERGRSPLSNPFPFSNRIKIEYKITSPFEKGIKGMSQENQPNANRIGRLASGG